MNYNKTKSQSEIDYVWNKAKSIPAWDSNTYRQDYAGAWIKKSEHGNTNSLLGWEIDHQKPFSIYRDDSLENKIPLHWENNREKSDNYPNWRTKISSSGNKNIIKYKDWSAKGGK